MVKKDEIKYIYSSFKLCVGNVNTGPPLNTTLSNLQIDLKSFCSKFEELTGEIKSEIKVLVLVKTQFMRFMGRAGAPFEIWVMKPSAAALLVFVSKERVYKIFKSGGIKEISKYVVLWRDICLISLFLFDEVTEGSLNMLYGSLRSVGLILVYE